MIIRNPSGRTIKLEILGNADNAVMALTIDAHTAVDLTKYRRALDALDEAEADDDGAQ